LDDKAENDNNEGTDESNEGIDEDNGRWEIIVGSLSFEFIAKIVHVLSRVGEKKTKKISISSYMILLNVVHLLK
jgi:hypothetical protein